MDGVKRIRKIVCSIVAACLLVNSSLLFADNTGLHNLAAPTKFKDKESKYPVQIELEIRRALGSLPILDLTSISSLGSRDILSRGIFRTGTSGTLFFGEAEEVAMPLESLYATRRNYCIRASIENIDYCCLISCYGSDYDISIAPYSLYVSAKASGRISVVRDSISPQMRASLNKYIEHEISTDNNLAIDQRIGLKMREGSYAIDTVTAARNILYRHEARKVYDQANIDSVIKEILVFMAALGIKKRDIIIEALLSRPIVFIPYSGEEELPMIAVDSIRVSAHSSPFATYIFLQKGMYEEVISRPVWSETVKEHVKRELIHEIGAICGLKAAIRRSGSAMSLANMLDEQYETYEVAQRSGLPAVDDSRQKTLEELTPVDLFDLEMRNDYASGKAPDRKGIFGRFVKLILACCAVGAMPAIADQNSITNASAPAVVDQSLLTSNAPSQVPPAFAFAGKYSPEEILNDEAKAKQFMKEYFMWESEYYRSCRLSGIVMDGIELNPFTMRPETLRTYTAPSKESLDIAVQVKVLMGNEYAVQLAGSGDRALAKNVALSILRMKIASYENFNSRYPAFGGFLPWIKVTPEGLIEPTSDWVERLPALDNGEWVWSLYAAYHALQQIGEVELAARYKAYFEMLAKNAPAIFYDSKARKVRSEVKIANTTMRSVVKENYTNNRKDYYLDDCYEGLMMVYFLDLFTDLPQAEKDHLWSLVSMEKVTTDWGTVYKGWPKEAPLDGSPHIKWAFLFLPFTDNPVAMKIYGIQEKIRSNLHKYGIPVSVNTPGAMGYTSYDPKIFGLYGAFPMIHYYALQNNVTAHNYGLAWLVSMLKVDKMQGHLGSGESYSVKSGSGELDSVSFVITTDGKMTLWLAMMGGNISEIRQALKRDGLYETFMKRVNGEYAETFGDVSSVIDKASFALPQPVKGAYVASLSPQTEGFVNLSEIWKYPVEDNWGENCTGSYSNGTLMIKYILTPAMGWAWAGGALRQPLTPGTNSVLYFRGAGNFVLKLETEKKSEKFTQYVKMKGDDKWTKVPLTDAAGKTWVVMVLDRMWGSVRIKEMLYSPDGKRPVSGGKTEEDELLELMKANPKQFEAVSLLPLYMLSGEKNWGNATVKRDGDTLTLSYNKGDSTNKSGWAGHALSKPFTMRKYDDALRIKGKGKFSIIFEGSDYMKRYVDLDKSGGVLVLDNLPRGMTIWRILIGDIDDGSTVVIDDMTMMNRMLINKSSGIRKPEKSAIRGLVRINGALQQVDPARLEEVVDLLWKAAHCEVPEEQAIDALARLAPDVRSSDYQPRDIYRSWIKYAYAIILGMGLSVSGKYAKPSDLDILAVSGRIKETPMEIFIPDSQIPGGETSRFRKVLESRFGSRLRTYQKIEDLKGMIKNPDKSVVMTVGLTPEQAAAIKNMQIDLAKTRFVNFSKTNLGRMTAAEYENYMVETISILILSRAITAEEARDRGSYIYQMLAHLLESHMENSEEVDTYLKTITDNSMDPLARLTYILKTILKAVPITAYKVMKPALEVLWSA
ncbi:MAG: hypothetical protein NC933_02095 [Candidatus Omnitrophica bacterium]|nr:hypothetical protein [Candidatus Omnitrophota bacterium]